VEQTLLATNPFFAGLPEDELEAVIRVATVLEFPAGDALTTEGEFGHALYIVHSGEAEVTRNGTRVGSIGAGDVVGEIAVLVSGRRTASIVATSPLTVVALFKRDVWRLERDAPEAGRRVQAALDAHTGNEH
jgi:CPA1 family monovalent cation:H+ antiporter